MRLDILLVTAAVQEFKGPDRKHYKFDGFDFVNGWFKILILIHFLASLERNIHRVATLNRYDPIINVVKSYYSTLATYIQSSRVRCSALRSIARLLKILCRYDSNEETHSL